ncbi:MAG TPA: carbohydrate ABC transporter permease, partial [Clostridiaceae bacterium]|nr:carbohydrate ABC transporter permease [Clostridiaceae bacterium]
MLEKNLSAELKTFEKQPELRVRRISFRKITFGKIIVYILMLLLVLFTALPLIYVINTAFKPLDELFLFPPRYFVRKPTTQNFHDLLLSLSSSTVPFSRYAFNSLFITVTVVFCTVIVSSMGAYGLVKHNPPGSKVLFTFIVGALMFSNHVTQIPRYMVVNYLGLINKYGALIIPNIAVAYNFFLMKQFIEQFPNELLESARIDGANEWAVFWKIAMPSLTPAWSTLVVFSFVSNWNDYFSPLIFITSQAMKTLPLALQTIAGGPAAMSIGRAGAVSAATFLMTIPTIIIFTFMQSKVMETMMYSG